jgi:hypothetical protein
MVLWLRKVSTAPESPRIKQRPGTSIGFPEIGFDTCLYVILALTYPNPALGPNGEMAIGKTPFKENLEEFSKTDRPSLNFVKAGVSYSEAAFNLLRLSLTNVFGTGTEDMMFV